MIQTNSHNKFVQWKQLCVHDCTPHDSKNKAERLRCIFPGSVLEIQKEIKEIFEEETFVQWSKTKKKVSKILL